MITINRSNFNITCNVNTVDTGLKETRLYSVKFKSHLKGVNKDQRLTRSNRPICKLDLRLTVRSMIGNIRETFLPKTGMQKKQVLQNLGHVNTVKACCIQAIPMSNGKYVDTVNTIELQ